MSRRQSVLGGLVGELPAWGYLALEQWQRRPLSRLTAGAFAMSMAGLGAIFASFYVRQYGHLLGTVYGRFDAVTTAIDFVIADTGRSRTRGGRS